MMQLTTPMNEQFMEKYYQHGLPEMGAYLQNINNSNVKLFEKNPEESIRNRKIHCTKEEIKIGKSKFWDWISAQLHTPIDYLEFGVYKGTTLKSMVKRITHADSRFYVIAHGAGLWRPDQATAKFPSTRSRIAVSADFP